MSRLSFFLEVDREVVVCNLGLTLPCCSVLDHDHDHSGDTLSDLFTEGVIKKNFFDVSVNVIITY